MTHPSVPESTPIPRRILPLALQLALGAAIALGVTRFSYGLLLPPMKSDLGWSYTLAGGMNTANALGYMIGALLAPAALRRHDAGRILVGCAVLASAFMAAGGCFVDPSALLLQRTLAGVASALLFIAGGLLAARLGGYQPSRAGLLLGIYYGGVGLGVVVSAALVPVALDLGRGWLHGWQLAWWLLAISCAAATLGLLEPARALRDDETQSPASATDSEKPSVWKLFPWALAAYSLFGLGYIGYMTFVVALLREQGASTTAVTVFYVLLGFAVMASSRIWAGLLDRFKGGQPLAILNAVTGAAAVIPAFTMSSPLLLVSGLGFGVAFMSVPAATTAFVRHNLPPSLFGAGISAFTVVFAGGQIIGPTLVGWVADGEGGVARGMILSAIALWLGAALAWRQEPASPVRPRCRSGLPFDG
jgi:predicted MFS family arabinose efflux permease